MKVGAVRILELLLVLVELIILLKDVGFGTHFVACAICIGVSVCVSTVTDILQVNIVIHVIKLSVILSWIKLVHHVESFPYHISVLGSYSSKIVLSFRVLFRNLYLQCVIQFLACSLGCW